MTSRDENFAERVMKRVVKELFFLLIGVIVLGLIILPFIKDKFITPRDSVNPNITLSNEEMSIEHDDALGYVIAINGVATNTRDKDIEKITIMYTIFDENDNEIGSAVSIIENVPSASNVNYRATLVSPTSVKPIRYELSSLLTI